MSNTKDKPLLILDLDETLIYASERQLDHASDFEFADYFVYRRPYLETFLLDMACNFELAIWSSGTTKYVQGILQQIVPDSVEPLFVWCRDRCGIRRDLETDEMYFQKDLNKVTKLGYSLSKVLILEDRKENVRRHFGNAVYIKPYFGSLEDTELKRLNPFLQHLSTVENVRTIEKRNWASFKPKPD